MAYIANKKNRKGKKPVNAADAFEFRIDKRDVLERVHFGSFELVKTKKGILFKNYSGYMVWTTPYAVGYDGKASETTLYRWLDNLIGTYHAFKDKLDEPFGTETHEDGSLLLNRDILEADKIITEGNLIHPMTAFVDLNRAAEMANSYIKWFSEMQERLSEAMMPDSLPFEDAEKMRVEEQYKAEMGEMLGEMLQEAQAEQEAQAAADKE